MTKYEKETIINFNEEECIASLYTCTKHVMSKMDKLCKCYPNDFKLTKQDSDSKTYEFDKRFITIRSPRKKKKLNEREKKELSKRLQNGKQKNKK